MSNIDGYYQYAITESTAWLTFTCPQERIDEIVADKNMLTVSAPEGWNPLNRRTYPVIVGDREYTTNWFSRAVNHYKPLPPKLQVYWVSSHEPTEITSGRALCYDPATQHAYWVSISV